MKKYFFVIFLFIFFFLLPTPGRGYESKEALNETIDVDFRYAYKLYNSNEQVEYNQMFNVVDSLFASNKSKLTFRNLSRFKDVDKVVVTLKGNAMTSFKLKLTYYNDDKDSNTMTIPKGSRRGVFEIPKGTYSMMEFVFINDFGFGLYPVEKIELLSTDGSSYTNEDVGIYVKSNSPSISLYSFDNGKTYRGLDYQYFESNTSGNIVIKNSCNFKSLPKEFKITGIDKQIPECSIKVTGKNSKKEITSDKWVNEGLNYSFNLISSGFSKADIYYCQDTDNTCIPETKFNGKLITKYNVINGSYYVRYRAVSNSMAMSEIYSYNAKVDSNPSEIDIKVYDDYKQIESNVWSSTDVVFSFMKTKGASKPKIYYCKDLDNTCIPNEEVKESLIINRYKHIRGIYYIRYYSVNEAGIVSDINSFTIKVDDSKKMCDIKKLKQISVN